MRAREIVLLVVLLIAGAAVYTYKTGGWSFAWDDEEGFFEGPGWTFEEQVPVPGPVPGLLEVVGNRGSVEVKAGPEGAVAVTCVKRVRARSEARAKDAAARVSAYARASADRLTVGTDRDALRRRDRVETEFKITVPPSVRVSVQNAYGPVSVDGTAAARVDNRNGRVFCGSIEGPVEIDGSYDDVRVESARGGARITTHNADVEAVGVRGDLRLSGRHGRLDVEDVSGRAEVDGPNCEIRIRKVAGAVDVRASYERVTLEETGAATVRSNNADVRASGIHGTLDVQGSHGALSAREVDGDLKVDGRNLEVRADGVRGGTLDVASSYEAVRLSGFSGRLALRLHNGDATLAPAALDAGAEIRNEYSTVRLVWPAGAENPFRAETKNGRIEWRLAVKPGEERSNGTSTLQAFAGSGRPAVTVVTTYGDITVAAEEPGAPAEEQPGAPAEEREAAGN